MIINLEKFIREERPYWAELENILNRLEKVPDRNMKLDEIKRFHYLYQRASADLAKIATFSAEQKIRHYLESLVASAYGEIHESRQKIRRFRPFRWFFYTFPQTFRRHIKAFWAVLIIMTAGYIFGAGAIALDPDSKQILMPFSHLMMHPSERVAKEESASIDEMEGSKARFSSFLMTHNTKVSIFALALGMTWGIGTIIVLFKNGVMLGAVVQDYIGAGEIKFVAGWLLPHGSIEIPAILLASQAGLVLAGAVIGWSARNLSFRARLREVTPDIATLITGVAIMLIWAGIIESFFSQYHEPVIPYEIKIGFGLIEFVLLVLFLSSSGSRESFFFKKINHLFPPLSGDR